MDCGDYLVSYDTIRISPEDQFNPQVSAIAAVLSRSEYDGCLRFLPSNEEHAPPPGQGTPFRFLTHVQTLYKDTKTDPASFSQSDSDEVTCIFQLHNRFW